MDHHPHSRPPSRSTTPFDSARVLNLPEAIGAGDTTTYQEAGGQPEDAGYRDGKESGESSSSNGGERIDYIALLPQKASINEASAAIAKLDRIQTAKENKRWWLKATGMGAVVKSKDGQAKKKERRRRRRRRDDSASGDLEMGTLASGSGLASASASTSRLDLDELQTPQEVHLGITSVPGYSVLAVKKAASKTKGVAGRVRGTSRYWAGRSTSPDLDQEEEEDDDPVETGRAHSLRGRKSPPPATSAKRRESLGHRLASVRHRPTQSLDGALLAGNGEAQQQQQREGEAKRRGSEAGEATQPLVAPATSPPPTGADTDPGLGAVAEDRHLEEQADETIIDKEQARHSKPIKPRLRIPTFHVQEPSNQSVLVDNDGRDSPTVRPVATRGALSFGSSSRDEENVEQDLLFTSPIEDTQIRRWPSSTSSSSSTADPSPGDRTAADLTHSRDSASSSSDDEGALASLQLEHGQSLTNKELRKQLKRDKALPRDSMGRATNLTHKVSRGLHYASSESRNRRAMDKFSPNQQRVEAQAQAQQQQQQQGRRGSMASILESGGLSRVNTSSSSARRTPIMDGGGGGGWNATFSMTRASRRGSTTTATATPAGISTANTPEESDAGDPLSRAASPPVAEPQQGEDQLKRTTTLQSMASSTAESQSHLHAPRPWHFRQRHRWAKAHADEGAAVPAPGEGDGEGSSPRHEAEAQADAEAELQDVLTKLAAEQAPTQSGVRFEWDVLYENQRGMLFFGLPKFSARTLLQWDPAPWVDARGQNSPYSIVNAQLPDPSWGWVYPEWVIDMAGDVDEQGWQYSGNFGRNPFAGLGRFRRGKPVAKGKEADVEMSQRWKERDDERRKKERQREDEGLEALKRSIKARGSKWTGRPDPGSFVRRRRWIRLRKRAALDTLTSSAQAAVTQQQHHQARGRDLTLGLKFPLYNEEMGADDDDSISLSSSSESDSEMDEEDTASSHDDSNSDHDAERDRERDYTGPYGKPSAFLPRRTAGHLQNGPDPLASRRSRSKAIRRHRKEFTGTLREFKTLLPTLLGCEANKGGRAEGMGMAMGTIDARNPFLSWAFIRRRLMDDDMSWKTTSLRQRERRHLQRHGGHHHQNHQDGEARRLPSAWSPASGAGVETRDFAASMTSAGRRYSESGDPSPLSWDLTRDALVEINFIRVKRVLRACKVDRQRLDLWRCWLGSPAPTAAPDERDHHHQQGGPTRSFSTTSTIRQPRRQATQLNAHPDANDVWDVLERRLDAVLYLFEYNASRATLLTLLLTTHDAAHPTHRYRGGVTGGGTRYGLPDREGHCVQVRAPRELDPLQGRRRAEGEGGEQAQMGRPREMDWVVGLAARLQFYSDVRAIADAIEMQRHGHGHGREENDAREHNHGPRRSSTVAVGDRASSSPSPSPSPSFGMRASTLSPPLYIAGAGSSGSSSSFNAAAADGSDGSRRDSPSPQPQHQPTHRAPTPRKRPSHAATHSMDLGISPHPSFLHEERRGSTGGGGGKYASTLGPSSSFSLGNGHAKPQAHLGGGGGGGGGGGLTVPTASSASRSRSPLTRVWSTATTTASDGGEEDSNSSSVPKASPTSLTASCSQIEVGHQHEPTSRGIEALLAEQSRVLNGAKGGGAAGVKGSSGADLRRWEEDAEREEEQQQQDEGEGDEQGAFSDSPKEMSVEIGQP